MNQVADQYSLLKATGNFYESLPESLVAKTQLELLKVVADFFPPIIRFALECRLHDNEQVDLQFCIRRDEDNLSAVYDWFQHKFVRDQEDEKILQFLKKWADTSSSFHKNISEVFLELDILPSGIKAPLLFFDLQPKLEKSQLKDVSFSILTEVLGENHSFINYFEAIIQACPAPAFVACLGVQFSRNVEVLRVNIKKLPIAEVAPFLEKIGYAWTGPALDNWISFVHSYADRVTLCIDIGKDIYPKIGFECFWNDQPLKETYWRSFIEKLNLHHRYKEDKIAAVLDWNKEIFPGEISDWPEHLWTATLTKPENEFTFLKKWVSHLKLTYCPDKEIELKAYLAYESLWKVKMPKELNNIRANQQDHTATPDVKQSISKGVDYILASQQQSGWWRDFNFQPGTSDEWVTAYVACHLARLKNPNIGEALDRAWKILKTRYRVNEGWGYNVLTPADADSTIWTWLFVSAAGFANDFPEPDSNIMDNYLAEDGGVITYALNGPIGKNSREAGRPSFNGWQIPHCCVTAAYALAGRQQAIDYLLEHQNPSGYWYSYWWIGSEYVTALSVEAFFNTDKDKYKLAIDIAVEWALEKAEKERGIPLPNDFKMALLLKIILCSQHIEKHHKLIKAIVNDLLSTQHSLGYWNPCAEMRVPGTNDIDHEKRENVLVVKDERRNFATITILDALHKYEQLSVS